MVTHCLLRFFSHHGERSGRVSVCDSALLFFKTEPVLNKLFYFFLECRKLRLQTRVRRISN
jgi:hypothetical protein